MFKHPSLCIIFDLIKSHVNSFRVTPDPQVHEVIQDIQDLL